MKKLHKTYVFLLGLTMLCACQKDFNELTDSNQRYAEFSFRTDSLFSKALAFDGNTASYPQIDTLPTGYCLRITAYCYDEADELVASKHIFTSLQPDRTIGLTHLQHGVTYRFVFLADIVKYDSQVDFFENWYQLGTSSLATLYLYSDFRHYGAFYDMVGMSTMMLSPDNQLTEVSFAPITYNGYCIFTNTEHVERIDINQFTSFRLENLKGIEASWRGETDASEITEGFFCPYSFCDADDVFYIRLVMDSKYYTIEFQNPDLRSFVATIDCKERTITQYDLY
jgi:hypothetical protein